MSSVFSEEIPPNGTIIVWENGRYVDNIRHYTNSDMTHVAIVLHEKRKENVIPFVYESSNPDVHRYTWSDYVEIWEEASEEFVNLRLHFLEPKDKYTNKQIKEMKSYADKQLGRAFGVKSFIFNRSMNTIHCAEYVGYILQEGGEFDTLGPRETPDRIYKIMKEKSEVR